MISFRKVFRFLTLMVGLLLTVPLLWLSIPLRLLHPLCRKWGVPPHLLPCDYIQQLWARFVMVMAGVRGVVFGLENVDRSRPTVYMANHSSGIDPFIVEGYVPTPPKWIFKKSLIKMLFPIFGLAYFLGHIAIDREDRKAAIEQLEVAAEKINLQGRSIAIFPEGTRSKDGFIAKREDFKKGAFYLATSCKGVPITPCYVSGAFEKFPKGTVICDPGTVYLHILPQIPNDGSLSRTELADRVYAALSEAEKKFKDHTNDRRIKNYAEGAPSIWNNVLLLVISVAVFKLFRFIFGLI